MSKLLLFTAPCSIWSCFAEPLSRPTINNGADRVAVRVPAALHHNSCIFAMSSGSWIILSLGRVSCLPWREWLYDWCLLEAIWWRVVCWLGSPTPTVNWSRKENTLPKIKMSFPPLLETDSLLCKIGNLKWKSYLFQGTFVKAIEPCRLCLSCIQNS